MRSCEDTLAWYRQEHTSGAPLWHVSEVHQTSSGTKYLKQPGFCLAGYTAEVPLCDSLFLAGRGNEEDSQRVALDHINHITETDRRPYGLALGGDLGLLPKVAGQICYASYGENRTPDSEIQRYMKNILDQRHLSVLEHAQVSFMVWGVSRSCVMEWDRQRHLSWSQLSQRYCDEQNLRFVMRPEFQESQVLSDMWEDDTDMDYRRYLRYKNTLIVEAAGHGEGTKKRKAINQAARAKLTNDVEVVLMVSGNLSSWRHFLTIRGTEHAEPEIRIVCAMLARSLKYLSPSVFQDVEVEVGSDEWLVVEIGR